MIIVAGGDSFVWGSELADSPHGGPDGYSRNTYSALLAGDNYICAAYPGISNKEIVTRTKKAVAGLSTRVGVIVSWTWSSRDNKIDSDDEILDLQEFLVGKNIPYMFTSSDNCVNTGHPAIKWENWFWFPPATEEWLTTVPRGFYQWAIQNKYQVASKDGHPLEQAHVDAANLMKDKFDELVKKHLE